VTPAPVLWLAGCGAAANTGCGCARDFDYCDEGVIARSDDLGNTWTHIFVDAGLGSVDFPSSSHGWAVGKAGAVFRTTDGGVTWVRKADGIQLPPEATAKGVLAFNAVRFLDETHGVIAGFGSSDEVIGQFGPITLYRRKIFALYTQDAGETWTPAAIRGDVSTATGSGVYASALCFTKDGVGILAGNPSLLTRDGGRTWENIDERLGRPAWGAACRDATIWVALAEKGVVRSDDDGQSWTPVGETRTNCCFAQLDFLSSFRGWRSGEEIERTDDGGATWSAVDAAIPSVVGTSVVRFATPDDGIWTSENLVGVTHDGGATWKTSGVLRVTDGYFGLADVAVVSSPQPSSP